MGVRLYRGLAFAAFFACATYSALAQAVPAATEGRSPWALGAGISGYNPDFEHGHLFGGTLWIDYTFTRVRRSCTGSPWRSRLATSTTTVRPRKNRICGKILPEAA
jgi:hypothetical protein